MKVRFAFILFLTASITTLFLYNRAHAEAITDYSARIGVIVFIFAITCIFGLFVVYEFYHTMHSEMKEQVEWITASKNDLQTTYDSVSMFMIEIGTDYRVINTNETLCRYLGRKKSHIIGKRLDAVLSFHPEAMQVIRDAIDESFSQNSNEKTEIETDGNIFEVFTFPLQEAADKLKKVLLMLNDVTHTRALYRQMLQDNKMVAIGQLAAGVAHEIRNPLGVIRNYCHLLKKSNIDDEEMKSKAISMIEKSVDRSGLIIDNLLEFSRITKDRWVTVNLFQTIESIISLEENLLQKNRITVSLSCEKAIEVRVILESLEVILINLINNAVDAMDQGGTITIVCEEAEDLIELRISDQGDGIPEDIIGSIFNPFFTTKENRNGCGLGLYIVYNEIIKLEGTIKVESQEKIGTTFTITLPTKRGETLDEQ